MAAQRDIDSLVELYLGARERLYRTITGDTGVGTKTYANTILKQLEVELSGLKRASRRFVDTRVPKEYKQELDRLYAYFTKHNLLMRQPAAFASLHNDAIYTIAREMQHQLDDALITVGRQVTRYVERAQDEALRQAGLRQTGVKMASGGTVDDMRKHLVKDLQDNGFMTVQYGAGKNVRQVPVDVYAAMVARSTTREAGNAARLNQLTANGYDLVKITEHYPTCEVCAIHQGRVYSISGNDRRFPPLSRAFGQYKNIHPNCRHSAHAWIESLQTQEEIADAIRQSNRPFKDSRSAQEIARYNAQQDKNRRARETLYQYERYKARLGNDAPKSFQAFARIKRHGGDSWGILQAQYRGMGYYNKALSHEPSITADLITAAGKSGMDVTGLEYRIKSQQSFLRKIASRYSPGGNDYEVGDILRYTYTAAPKEFAGKTMQSIEILRDMGYNTSEVKNTWLNPINPYNGVNTNISTSSGQRFELQYHTPQSYELKSGEMHQLYEAQRRIKDPTSAEFLALQNKMFELSDDLEVPDNIERVKLS